MSTRAAAAAAVLTLLGLLGACGDAPAEPPPATVVAVDRAGSGLGPGDPAPGFVAATLDGSLLSLAELRGRPVVVNFWLTTCAPCVREMPLLAGAVADHADDGLVVLAVNPEEDAVTIEAFLDELGVDGLRVVLDPDANITHAYLAPAYPTTYFVDRDGIVQYRRFGEVKEEHLQVGLERTL